MTTDIEVNRAGTFEAIDYNDFTITTGTSTVQVAPTATVETTATEDIQAGQELRITIDSTVAFEGVTQSAGKKRTSGRKKVVVEHAGVALMDETVTISGEDRDVDVLQAALNAADSGGSFTLSTGGATTLNETYAVENRTVKRVFRDMADRTGNLWWIAPGGSTITYETISARGTWQVLDAQTDRFGVVSFDEGSAETVRNDVTVIGTGDVAVEASASDSGSISTYGRRPGDSPYKVSYITTQSEADAAASALVQPDPLASGEIVVGKNVGDVVGPLANYTIDLTDASKDIDETGLVIQEQTIEQGRATLKIGQGAGDSLAKLNRQSKSNSDVTEPGSVVDTSRIADDSVDSNQLVDASVIEAKLDDASVATAKIQDNAVVNGSLADLSVSETKIQDNSISTPKLIAEAVTANEIEADTITAAQIAAGTITALEIVADTITASEIASRTITALEIATDTLTANEIDVLDLDTTQFEISVTGETGYLDFASFAGGPDGAIQLVPEGGLFLQFGTAGSPVGEIITDSITNDQLSELNIVAPTDGDNTGTVGRDPNVFSQGAYSEMWAYNYYDAGTGTTINDGGDPLGGLADGHGPPDHAAKTDDDGNVSGYDLSSMARDVWDVCRAQQRVIEDLTERVEALERQNA